MKQHQRQELQDDRRQYAYDAFIGYSQQDSHWVATQLVPNLEQDGRMRLCIHYRDWLGGRDIIDNILESVESSRKTVLIVSNAFAMSQWCHFELTMAQSRIFQDGRDNLILVLLHNVADGLIAPRLRLQMERQTYFEWTDNEVGQQFFWAKLRCAITGETG